MRLSRYLAIFLAVLAVVLPLPALFNYYCDPYQIYHPSRFPEAGLGDNQRYQNAGLINSWLADPAQSYDSILVGTSLSANFTQEDAQRYLHWRKPLRLFMNGGHPVEQAALVKHALSTQRVQKVLWELHPTMYSSPQPPPDTGTGTFPLYLYNHQALDDFPYLFNQDILRLSWRLVTGNFSDFGKSLNNLGAWDEHHGWIAEKRAAFNHPDQIRKLLETPSLQLQANPSIDTLAYPELTNHLFPVIDSVCNGKVEIVFFIAPISKFSHLGNIEYSMRALYLPRFVLQHIQPCRNVQLYAFDTEGFSNDFANYKDHEHYLPEINDHLLDLIGRGEGRLTPETIGDYESRLREILNNKAVVSSYRG